MNLLEQPETSTLPVRFNRFRAGRGSNVVVTAALAFAMGSTGPVVEQPAARRSWTLGLSVDPDYSFALARLDHRRTFLTGTFGSDSTLANCSEEAQVRQERRVSLLDRDRMGTLSGADAAELQRLQDEEDAKIEAELRPSIDRMRRLLHG